MRPFLTVLSLFALAGCATLDDRGPPPTGAPIDAGRFYSGTWYEIGRRPMPLTDGCVAGGTTYLPQGEDRVQVLDFCHAGSPAGPLKRIGGPARIRDPGTNAVLRVSYRLLGFIPVSREYRVLEHGDDYSWFISSDPSFRNLWIYTRSPRPGASEVADLTARAHKLGYDTGLLEFPATGS